MSTTTTTTPTKSPRRPCFPANLTDLNRFRKTVHGHDGSSRIVMVRKTDQRTFASIKDGEKPKLETITRETIETFHGQRTECKITTEKKNSEQKFPDDFVAAIAANNTTKKATKNGIFKRKTSDMEFQQECLKAHNECRRKHGVPPLKLNPDLCRYAQEWADTLAKRGVLDHRDHCDYGENIYCISSTNPDVTVTGDQPVRNWYQEMDKHLFGVEPKSLVSGHFTQIVWKETKELGVAHSKYNKRIVVVANYSPAGNFVGHFAENVPPPGGFKQRPLVVDNDEIRFSKLTISSPPPKVSDFLVKRKSGIGTEGNFEQDFLDAHNEYRRRHGVPPLKLDRKLCQYSEEWARILASRNLLDHRKNSPYGENIYSMYSSDQNFTITGHAPVDSWYEEAAHHHFGREPVSLKTGHFTQVVWKSSDLLGVGVAKSRQGSMYVVANYSPAGNFVGEYAENVPPLISSSPPRGASGGASPASSSGKSDDADYFEQFQLDSLRVHNEYRRKHGVPPLKLSRELCDHAKEWAEHCARTKNMAHRPLTKYGENIFCMYSSDYGHVPSARDAVKKWYDEVDAHAFGAEKINHGTLHFTQVVWRNSNEFGIAMARNDKGHTYVVANYNPRGNVVGNFASNVPKPKP